MRLSFSGAALKYAACAAMVADHVGLLFFPDQLAWRAVGRLAFPLFAFLIAEGFRKTSDLSRYFFRLVLFAAISVVPFALIASVASVSRVNIFFTLAAGLLALLIGKRLPLVLSVPAIVALCAAAEGFGFDYGAYGVVTILASSLFLKRRAEGAVVLSFLPILYTLAYLAAGFSTIQFFASFSVPFLMRYDGTRGSQPRWFFYWFYPVHLALLWAGWVVLHVWS